MADRVTLRRGAKRGRLLLSSLHRAHGVASRASPADVAVSLVHAAHPAVTGCLPLSVVDTELVFDAPPLSWTWFYESAMDTDALSLSLSRALVAYPLLAGRLVHLPLDSAGRRRAAVACGNQGVLFTQLRATRVPLPRSRGAANGELPSWGAGWAGPHSLQALLDDASAPLLEILLITYEQGCSLCVKSSHGLTDGLSLASFIACWSRTHAAPDAPLPWPLLDRAVQDAHLRAGDAAGNGDALCGCGAPQRAVTSPSGAIEDPLPASTLARLALRAVVDPSMGFHLHTRAVVGAAFHFNAAQLARIKAAAAPPQAEGVPAEASDAADGDPAATAAAAADGAAAPTTFDALTALLWRSVVAARKPRGVLDRAAVTPPRLCFPANIRARLEPPLPASFCGNATMLVLVETDADTMRTADLGAVAAAVQRTKQAAVTAASIREQLQYLDAETRSGRKKRWAVNPFDNGLLLSDWRFPEEPLYAAATFGDAAPFWFEPAIDVLQRFPYVGCLLPSPPGSATHGGVTVLLNLPADEVQHVDNALKELPAVLCSRAE